MTKVYTKQKINNRLDFFVPITESYQGKDGEFLISGPAIHETTTRNGTKFVSEELKKSAKSLRDKPILKDHINSVDTIVGRTTNKVSYDENVGAVMFEARITDEKMQLAINRGDIKNVSVGAMVGDVEEQEDGSVLVKDIEFVELSLVAVPADPDAGFAKAIAESFNTKKLEAKMSEEITKKEEKLQEVSENLKKLEDAEVSLKEKIKALENKILEKKVAQLEEELEDSEESEEAPEEEQEEKEEVTEQKLKGKTIVEKQDEDSHVFVEKNSNGGFNLSVDYEKAGFKNFVKGVY